MQSFQDLALMVSKKKANIQVFFFQWESVNYLSWTCEKNQKQWPHDLLDIIDNHTKFQLNQIRTQDFQLRLFDTAVTLKCNKKSLKMDG